MSTPTREVSVRPARREDAAAIAQVQVDTYVDAYTRVLPDAALGALFEADPEGQWQDALEHPPSPRHHVLAAMEDGQIVGFAAVAPASDADLDPAAGEVLVLLVHPAHSGRGHGSRLLAAAVDALRSDGAGTAVVWLFDADGAMQGFYQSAGWAPDGARRDLDMGELVPELRLHTDLRTG